MVDFNIVGLKDLAGVWVSERRDRVHVPLAVGHSAGVDLPCVCHDGLTRRAAAAVGGPTSAEDTAFVSKDGVAGVGA